MPTTITSTPAVRLRFGLFELDPAAEELRRAGIRVRIQGQPLRILLYLAQHPGEIVTREELHQAFWKAGTTVDLDRSLAAAIHKIRECLGDSATSPRFVETVSRSGYRFIAPVAAIHPQPTDAAAAAVETLSDSTARPDALSEADEPGTGYPAPRIQARRVPPAALRGATGAAFACLLLYAAISRRPAPPGSAAIRRLTHQAAVSRTETMSPGFPGAVADHARIYFPRQENGRGVLAVVMLNDGGDTTAITLPEELGSPVADDVSPDGLRLLLRNSLSTAAEQPLWVASPAGQTARQVPGVLAHDSAWMPDGETILYANGDSLFTVRDDGSGIVRFATLPARAFGMRWSPDGKHMRLTLRDDRTLDTTLWELRSDGSGAHQILAGWHAGEPVCCGTYLGARNLYVFQAGGERAGSLWAVPADRSWMGAPPEPFRVADGPLNYSAPAATPNGRGVIVTAAAPSFRLLGWSNAEKRLLPAPAFLNDAARIEFSRDHRWVAWVRREDGSLWRSRADGADRVRVMGAPYEVFSAAWSPDGRRLAVMARRAGSPWRVVLADVNSGHTEELLRDDPHNQADPQWMPDGSAVVFGRLPQRLAEPALPPALFRVDLANRSAVLLPGSEGLFSPRVSPDGRTLVALNSEQTALRQLDLATGIWTTAGTGHFDQPTFRTEGRALVYRDFTAPGMELHELNLDTHRVTAFSARLQNEPGLEQETFAGLMADDAPAISSPRDSSDLYLLDIPE